MAGVFVVYAAMMALSFVIHYIKICFCKPYIVPRIADGSTSMRDVAPSLKRQFSTNRLLVNTTSSFRTSERINDSDDHAIPRMNEVGTMSIGVQ